MRVVIADDEMLLREGLARLLEEAGFDVVGKAGSAEELVRRVGKLGIGETPDYHRRVLAVLAYLRR